MPKINLSPARIARQPLSRKMSPTIQFAGETAAALQPDGGRFEIYGYLEAVYSVYFQWKRRKRARRSALRLAEGLCIAQRKGMSPIRVLIEATLPSAHFKQKSRWVRALEYASSEDVPASKFRRFVHANGGLAGCARLAAGTNRKRRRSGGDWND